MATTPKQAQDKYRGKARKAGFTSRLIWFPISRTEDLNAFLTTIGTPGKPAKPKSKAAQYKAAERARKKEKGLRRIGMWVSPDHAAKVRDFARSLEQGRES